MGKLHLESLGGPLCGRQLNNHRETRSQIADKVQFASSTEQFLQALKTGEYQDEVAAVFLKGGACRHCAREAGLLPRVTRAIADGEGEETNWGDE